MRKYRTKAGNFVKSILSLFSSKIINVEPVIFLASISLGIYGSISPMFVYFARCVNIYSSQELENVTEFCLTVSQDANRTVYENAIQSDVAALKKYQTLAGSLPALFIAPVLGAWADGAGGRKYPLLISLLSPCLVSALTLISTFFYKETSIVPFVIGWECLGGLLGGTMVFLAASMAMVTDSARIQKPDGSKLSLRMGIASAIQGVGFLLGSMATSHFIDSGTVAYFKALLVANFFNVLALVYAAVFVHETGKHVNHSEAVRNRSLLGLVQAVMERYSEVLRTLTIKRIGWTRLCLNLTVAFVFIEFFALDNNLLYLFVKKHLQWDDKTFTYYNMSSNVLMMIGYIIWPLFIERTKFMGKDAVLIIMGFIFNTAYWGLISVTNSSQLMFIAVVLTLFTSAMSPGFKALVPKLVTEDETARVFTGFGIAINLAPIVSAWIFVSIYQETFTWWAGFCFFVCAIIQVIVLVGFCITYYLLIKTYRQAKATGHEIEVSEFQSD